MTRLELGGVSAGAQLAASVTQLKHLQQARSFTAIRGQILMIPALSHGLAREKELEKFKDQSVWSYEQCKDAPILPVSMITQFVGLLFPEGGSSPEDLVLNPGHALPEQVKGLPPTVFGIAGLDPLRDQGLLYAQLLAENG